MVDWEETAHQNAALRWLKDFQKTGFGAGCTDVNAKSNACAVASVLVRIHEAWMMAGWRAENMMIDMIGDVWLGSIIERGRALADE